MTERDEPRRTGLQPGKQGADDMGGATGVTGGGESGAPGEGVEKTERSPRGGATERAAPSDPGGGGPAVGGFSPTPEEDTD
jgi:hypothetical protein